MKKIKHYVKQIDEELKGAECYAEKYLEYKADGEIDKASKYKAMAEDELKHSDYIHTLAVEDIRRLREVYTPPVDMLEKWDASHNDYIAESAYVKSLLTL